MTTSDKDQKNPPVIITKESLLMLEKAQSSNGGEEGNRQFIGRATPFIEAKSLEYLKAFGNDADGVPFADYDISSVNLQSGDKFICTLVDLKAQRVVHVALIVRSKTECTGSYVMYVYTRAGSFVHRIPATDSVLRGVNRAQSRVLEINIAAVGLFTTYSAHGMTMEEAVAITSAPTDHEVVNAMEKWVAEHGGMDRILEKNLNGVLFEKPVVRSEFHSRRAHLLTMKEGEYGPLPPHPGIVKKQAESMFNMTPPEIEEGEVITQSRVMLETGVVLHLAKRKADRPTVYCWDKEVTVFISVDGVIVDVVQLEALVHPVLGVMLEDRFYDEQGFMKPQRFPEGLTPAGLQSEYHRLLMPKDEQFSRRVGSDDSTAVDELLNSVDKNSPGYKAAMSVLTQPNLTANDKAMVWQADLDAAKRLAEVIIRPNKDGLEINYGRLALGHLEGIPFLAQVEDLEKAGLPCIYVSRIPKFQQQLKLEVTWTDHEAPKLHPNSGEREVVVYVLEKEDLAQLGAILSKNGRYVRAVYRGCFLQTWSTGFIYNQYRPITDFLDGLTEEEIEEAKF